MMHSSTNRFVARIALTFAMLAASSITLADCYLFCGKYTKTRYPIVLVHGAGGFSQIGPLEYFNGIPGALAAGGATVYVARLSAFNSTEKRGDQLLAQVQEIVAITGKEKVNLIGHSHGGPTARYVAAVAPELVASVTSVAGHTGYFDPATSNTPPPPVPPLPPTDFFHALEDLAAWVMAVLSGGPLPQSSLASEASLSGPGLAVFNYKYHGGLPTTPCGKDGAHVADGVRYYSWSGDASGTGQHTNFIDPTDFWMSIAGNAYAGQANDGLIAACNTHLGMVIRDNYFQNHLDEINQMFGLVSPFAANPKTLFREHANRLKNASL